MLAPNQIMEMADRFTVAALESGNASSGSILAHPEETCKYFEAIATKITEVNNEVSKKFNEMNP